MSFGGNNRTFGYYVMEKNVNLSSDSIIRDINMFAERLRSVLIENLDFRELLNKYNYDKDCFIYLDPPYVLSSRGLKMYEYEMTDDDHRDLLNILLTKYPFGSEVKVMLSGYDNDLYKVLDENGWIRKEFDTICFFNRNSREVRNMDEETQKEIVKRKEIIWLNYNLY
jgi:DNA adenine methylase